MSSESIIPDSSAVEEQVLESFLLAWQAQEAGVARIADFLLARGSYFRALEHLPRGVRRGRRGECWRNGRKLALRQPDRFLYVEGYAVCSPLIPIPIHHGWVVDRAGLVVELTWDAPGCEYFGLPIKHDYLQRASSFDLIREMNRLLGRDAILEADAFIASLDDWMKKVP